MSKTFSVNMHWDLSINVHDSDYLLSKVGLNEAIAVYSLLHNI
jgi:hypothetical protein